MLQVARCKSRGEQDCALHMELYELIREGMTGNIAPGVQEMIFCGIVFWCLQQLVLISTCVETL